MLKLPRDFDHSSIHDQVGSCRSAPQPGSGLDECEHWAALALAVSESSFPPIPTMPVHPITTSNHGFIGMSCSAGFAQASGQSGFEGGKSIDPPEYS